MRLVFVSQWGGSFDLTDNEHFWLTNVSGLTAAGTDISSFVIGGVDGDRVNSVRAQPRPITLDLRVKSDEVERAKRAILEIIKLKQSCTLVWSQDDRTWTINGIVDSIDMPRFNNKVTMQIGIYCSVPFWEDLNEVVSEISTAKPLHYFTDDPYDMLYFPEDGIPLGEYDSSRTETFFNAGDVAVGMEIEILAYKTVTNPIIYDQYGNYFGVGYGDRPVTLYAGDKLVINTRAGQKSVTLNGISQLDKVKPQSTWLQFEAGENQYTINSDDSATDNMIFTLIYKQRYI